MKTSLLCAFPFVFVSIAGAQTAFGDADWYTTTSSQALAGGGSSDLELVSGTAGRGIHAVFSSASLNNIGDSISLHFVFRTPITVGADKGAAVRFGFFQSGGADIAKDFASSTDDVWEGVLGYAMDFDVNRSDASDDVAFREKLTPQGDRLLGTTGNFAFVASGGPGYTFSMMSSYNGEFSVTRTGADELTLFGTLSSEFIEETSFSTATSAAITSFDLVGVHVNSNTFGSSSDPDEPDNGLDFQSLVVSTGLAVIPEPSSLALLLGLIGLMGVVGRRRCDS